MRQVFAALVLVLGTGLLAHPAAAQTTNPQQERMKALQQARRRPEAHRRHSKNVYV
jgi:hypothetical protein